MNKRQRMVEGQMNPEKAGRKQVRSEKRNEAGVIMGAGKRNGNHDVDFVKMTI